MSAKKEENEKPYEEFIADLLDRFRSDIDRELNEARVRSDLAARLMFPGRMTKRTAAQMAVFSDVLYGLEAERIADQARWALKEAGLGDQVELNILNKGGTR